MLSSSSLRRSSFTSRTRREFLKLTTAGVVSTATAETLSAWSPPAAAPKGPIEIRVTSAQRKFESVAPGAWRPYTPQASSEIIELNPQQKFQEILGFGAAFTDASCYLFSRLPVTSRAQLFHDFFHPSEMGLKVCRTCIGASDYSTELFSYDEGEPDPDLKRFSLDHDKPYVLPTLREARQVNPDLFLFSSPWSPPGWMKANGSMLGGSMRKKHFASCAQYFVKFLQSYAAEGVPIQAVTTQNEVDTDQDGRMPACLWGQEYEIEFVGKHLGPALQAVGLSTKIWLLDHNYNLWGRVICSFDDPEVRKHCSAVAWHGYAGDAAMMSKAHSVHPNVSMHWTEGGPDYTSSSYATDWPMWGGTFTDALENWCSSITAWNFILDEQGRPNIGPFPCGGLVTVDSKSADISQSGQYWALSHFARSIRSGAFRFASTAIAGELRHVAFRNPDGSNVLIITNHSVERPVTVRLSDVMATLALDPNSITTIKWT